MVVRFCRIMSRRPSDSPFASEDPARAGQARLFEPIPLVPDYSLEKSAGSPLQIVAGIDEAGRGPLAGPVVAAAVILDVDRIPAGLNDSKILSHDERVVLFEQIVRTSHVAVASSSAARIDATDIRLATLEAMRRALAALPERPAMALIDGRDVPPGLCCPGKAVIKGDARSMSIAAASIVAKVTRDRMMHHSARLHPAYGFERHVGYGTADHRRAIADHGPCPLHRMTFSPLRTG
jgi:ribonuclease HII